jgi:hypothetical protein
VTDTHFAAHASSLMRMTRTGLPAFAVARSLEVCFSFFFMSLASWGQSKPAQLSVLRRWRGCDL